MSRNDLRLVHFGGLAMVEAVLPPELDLHLAMRVARERYGATLSLARACDRYSYNVHRHSIPGEC